MSKAVAISTRSGALAPTASESTSLLNPPETVAVERKHKRFKIAGIACISATFPATVATMVGTSAAMGWNESLAALLPSLIPFSLGVGGYLLFDILSLRYYLKLDSAKRAKRSRDELQLKAELEAWREATIERLRERFAVDLTVEEFDELQYPRELPTAEKTIRYGSIDKYLSLEDGSGALQQVTLIWAEGEMKLLTTRLTELGITR